MLDVDTYIQCFGRRDSCWTGLSPAIFFRTLRVLKKMVKMWLRLKVFKSLRYIIYEYIMYFGYIHVPYVDLGGDSEVINCWCWVADFCTVPSIVLIGNPR